MTLVSNTHEALNKHGTIERETERKSRAGRCFPSDSLPARTIYTSRNMNRPRAHSIATTKSRKNNTDKYTDKYTDKHKDKHKDKHRNQRTLNRENQIHDKSTMVRACNVDNLKAFCIHAPQEPVVDAQHPR
jgi:hypothetical protein